MKEHAQEGQGVYAGGRGSYWKLPEPGLNGNKLQYKDHREGRHNLGSPKC